MSECHDAKALLTRILPSSLFPPSQVGEVVFALGNAFRLAAQSSSLARTISSYVLC